jgi:hypothetical protein
MTPSEQVAFARQHRDHFEAACRHNLDVVIQRRRGDWSGRYRNAWAELGAYASTPSSPRSAA